MSVPAGDLVALARPVRHEVNNLLAALMGTIDIVARQAATDRDAARAARMRAAAERLEALIKAYLALAAPPEMPGGTDAAATIAALWPLLLLLAPGRDVEISADPGLPLLALPVAELQAIALAAMREAASRVSPGGRLTIVLAAVAGGAELSVAGLPPRRLEAAR